MEPKKEERGFRDVAEVELRVDDFTVDAEGNVRIASQQIAERVRAAIEKARSVREPQKGRMVIPIEP